MHEYVIRGVPKSPKWAECLGQLPKATAFCTNDCSMAIATCLGGVPRRLPQYLGDCPAAIAIIMGDCPTAVATMIGRVLTRWGPIGPHGTIANWLLDETHACGGRVQKPPGKL